MGKLVLHGLDASPPVRACLLTLKALDLTFEYKQVNPLINDHKSDEYLDKNPQHTVPTLEDDGHAIWDSHAIIAYLVRKYGKTDALYPKDYLKRAVVDQRLHFETGVVFQGALTSISYPLLFNNVTDVPQHKIDAIVKAYDFLETFLKHHSFMAGDELTIADFSLITTVTSLAAFMELDAVKYPKINAWIGRMKQLPYYQEANGKGVQQFVEMCKSKNFTIVK